MAPRYVGQRNGPSGPTGPGAGGLASGGDRPPAHLRSLLTNRTYRVTEIVGTSPDGIDQAIRNGIERASQTLRHIDWFEVTQVRGQAKDGGIEHFQVGLKIGFRLEDDGPVS